MLSLWFFVITDDASLLPCPQTFLQAQADRAADLPWTNTAILQPIRTNVFFIILEPLIASGQTFRGILRPGVILLWNFFKICVPLHYFMQPQGAIFAFA